VNKNLVLEAGFDHGLTGTSTQWEGFAGFTYLLYLTAFGAGESGKSVGQQPQSSPRKARCPSTIRMGSASSAAAESTQ
jgi:hypothetical protein